MRNDPARLGFKVGVVWHGFDLYLYTAARRLNFSLYI
jgi:hypothetical protein